MHAGSLEALLDNLEQLERGLWPPKRPRSSFIYFSAASKAAIQQQILEEEQQILKEKEREQEPEQQRHQVESADTRTAGQKKTKSTPALAARNGSSSRRKKSRFSELLSLSWRNLCAEERQVYEQLAAADHARFERERDIWVRSHQESHAMRQQRMWEEAQGAQTTQRRATEAEVSVASAGGETNAPHTAIGGRDARDDGQQQNCLIKREPT